MVAGHLDRSHRLQAAPRGWPRAGGAWCPWSFVVRGPEASSWRFAAPSSWLSRAWGMIRPPNLAWGEPLRAGMSGVAGVWRRGGGREH